MTESFEIWKPIKGYEGIYEISNFGRGVKSLDRHWSPGEKILQSTFSEDGYLQINLYKDKIHRNIKIHRLVAETFIPNLNNYPQINHKNGIKTDNRVENLEWCTHQENIDHVFEIGKRKRKQTKTSSKLTLEQIKEIKRLLKTKQYQQKELAVMFNRDPAVISRIKNNKVYSKYDLSK